MSRGVKATLCRFAGIDRASIHKDYLVKHTVLTIQPNSICNLADLFADRLVKHEARPIRNIPIPFFADFSLHTNY